MKSEEQPNEGFLNESGLKFNDISSELEREYFKYDKNFKLDGNPLYLHVSASGGHRLYTDKDWCYYVQPKEGWAIRWKVREGKPHFVK